MSRHGAPKIRGPETWSEIRRAWERGETAASLALRYDVGLANLWRRRAAEGWRRLRGEDPAPEPLEGWARFAVNEREAFEGRLKPLPWLDAEMARLHREDWREELGLPHGVEPHLP